MTTPIWEPGAAQAQSPIVRFAAEVAERRGVPMDTYRDLWSYSVAEPRDFWSSVIEFFDVIVDDLPADPLPDASMPGARWFPGAQLNFAENALRHRGDRAAVIAADETGTVTEMSWDQLRSEVGSLAARLRALGVRRGDPVVGYLPNSVHAVVAFLATASIGAIWSACGQDYGSTGALARFRQLEPTVLFAADGYRWNGRTHDRRSEVDAVTAGLPSLRAVVRIPILGTWSADDPADHAVPQINWMESVSTAADPEFVRVEFSDPLWVLFSSGTTGVPKGIVHSHGGVTIDHYKLHGLHHALRPGDRYLCYTTTNWMMWNMVVSALLVGATIVLYDGSPTYPGPDRLWQLAADHRVAVLGLNPGLLAAAAKAGLRPGADLDLAALRILGSTGSPLPRERYHWVKSAVGEHVQVSSVTGGTDVVSGFAGSAPTTPVWPGELSAPMLGVDLRALDEHGEPVIGELGELVVASPMPTMPVSFWHDPDGTRYRAAYFDTYPGMWRHGDWVTITDRGSVIVSGRSDATLNRQGVRLGSTDIYAVVEPMPEIAETLVIGAELDDGGYWLPMFVVPADGVVLDDDLRARIADTIRRQASPRHVPDDIIAVPAIPHTRTGKKLEIPVKRLIQGVPLAQVAGVDTTDDADALAYFERFAARGGRPPIDRLLTQPTVTP